MPDHATRLAPDLHFELTMLAALPGHIHTFSTDGPALLRIACLESFLVHARNLIEFLVGRPHRSTGNRVWKTTDLQPMHYLTAWSPSHPNQFDDSLTLIDQHLSHLSLQRGIGEGPPEWWYWALANDLVATWGEFVDTVAGEGSPYFPIFRAALDEARRDLAHGEPDHD